MLHRLDPDPRWLEAAFRGVHFVEQSRQKTLLYRLPNDHWLMMAIAALLPQCAVERNAPISRQRMVDHSMAIGRMMMAEQWRVSWVPGLNGAFTGEGAITPTSTRLEGLVDLYHSLPPEHPQRARIQTSIARGITFILRGQIKEGAGRGGFKGGLIRTSFRARQNLRAEIRIDYVQHALCALIGHYRMYAVNAPWDLDHATSGNRGNALPVSPPPATVP
jgi:hypothetical protein